MDGDGDDVYDDSDNDLDDNDNADEKDENEDKMTLKPLQRKRSQSLFAPNVAALMSGQVGILHIVSVIVIVIGVNHDKNQHVGGIVGPQSSFTGRPRGGSESSYRWRFLSLW